MDKVQQAREAAKEAIRTGKAPVDYRSEIDKLLIEVYEGIVKAAPWGNKYVHSVWNSYNTKIILEGAATELREDYLMVEVVFDEADQWYAKLEITW